MTSDPLAATILLLFLSTAVTYYNPDDTSGIGGNIQGLTDGDGLNIHGSLSIPPSAAALPSHRLPVTSHDAGNLRLNFIRENGYRAVVSQVWVVERADTTDTAAPVSAITAPVVSAQLSGGLSDVTGTATDGAGSGILSVEVGIDGGSGASWRPVTQLRSDGGWSYRWSLPADGAYTLYVRATDRAGNLEVPGAGVFVVVNQTPPAAVTGVSAYDTAIDSGNSISILWTLSADDDGGGADDLSSYRIERREGITGSFALAGTVSAGIGSYIDAATVDGTQYYYRIVAVDLAGNQTASAVYGPAISIDNNIPDGTPPEDVTGLTGTPGNGFVYLAWTKSVNTALDLVDQLLDISTDGGTTWGVVGPAYTDGGVVNLGKEPSFRLVEGLTNGTGYRFRVRVKDSSNNTSLQGALTGVLTPSATAGTTVSGTITTNTTWAAGVFYVSGSDITVNAGVTLTINPGVIVKFGANRGMTVRGTLTAGGTAGSPVVFTAYADDSYGGDSNNNGPSSGTPGSWNRLYFDNTSSSRLDHAVVRYGGSGNDGNVYLYYSNVPVISSTISNGSSYGIYTHTTSPLIEGNTISNNGDAGIYHYNTSSPVDRNNTITGNSNGIYVQYATPAIDGNTITGNTNYGIYHYDTRNAPEITNNTITGNNIPVRLTFSSLPGASAGNILSPNTRNQIEFWGNTLSRSLILPASPELN